MKYIKILFAIFFLLFAITFFVHESRIGEYLILTFKDSKSGNELYYRIIGASLILCAEILFAFWGYKLAQKKGKDKLLWAVICFWATIWGILFLQYSKSTNNKS